VVLLHQFHSQLASCSCPWASQSFVEAHKRRMERLRKGEESEGDAATECGTVATADGTRGAMVIREQLEFMLNLAQEEAARNLDAAMLTETGVGDIRGENEVLKATLERMEAKMQRKVNKLDEKLRKKSAELEDAQRRLEAAQRSNEELRQQMDKMDKQQEKRMDNLRLELLQDRFIGSRLTNH